MPPWPEFFPRSPRQNRVQRAYDIRCFACTGEPSSQGLSSTEGDLDGGARGTDHNAGPGTERLRDRNRRCQPSGPDDHQSPPCHGAELVMQVSVAPTNEQPSQAVDARDGRLGITPVIRVMVV